MTKLARRLVVLGMTVLMVAVVASAALAHHKEGHTSGPPEPGSVGNADGKVPPGLANNPNNKGHECNANQGVGKGNPAHSGCVGAGELPDPPDGPTVNIPSDPQQPDPDDPDDPDVPDVIDQPGTPDDEVLGETVQKGKKTRKPAQAKALGAALPFTGPADLIPFAALGFGLMGSGGALMLRGRRRS